jgi:hypothetical protein
VEVDKILTTKAQNLNLTTIKVIGDGNCLQYATNAAHKEQTNLYLADNDDLRLLATALAREHIRQQIVTATDDTRGIMEDELKVIELTATKAYYHYPGTYMNALASIRHGPLIVITDGPGMGPATYLPIKEMTEILFGTKKTNPAPQAPYLPPIYILNRTTVNPPHYDATKPSDIPTPTPVTQPITPPALDATVEPTRQPAMPPRPPTIQRLPQHPELGLPRDAPHLHPGSTPGTDPRTETPPDPREPPNNRRNLEGANPQTRRRSQDLITSTPSPENRHTARVSLKTQTSKKDAQDQHHLTT